MLGDDFTVTIGGSGGTDVVCPLINMDNYASEYLLKGATYDTRVRVKHMHENVKSGQKFDRHLLEFTKFDHVDAETLPVGRTTQVYVVIRNDPDDTVSTIVDVAEALAYAMSESTLTKIIGWES